MSAHEREVLSAMLLSGAAIDEVAPVLTGRDFLEPIHERIYDAILSQVAESQPVDSISVGDRLPADRTYLAQLIALSAITASAGYHADKVRDAARLRRVREVGMRLEALSIAGTDDPLEVVNTARAELDTLLEAAPDESHESAVYAAIDSLDQPIGVPTPWRVVSNNISGWSRGMLYVIGARPGVGKTVMGVGALLDIGRRGQHGVMFSMEMPKTELYLRMLSNVGGVDGERIMHRSTTRADDENLAKAAAHIARLPLAVDDRSALTLAQIRARVRTEQRKHPVGLVVVDYLGLVKPPASSNRTDRRVQVDEIAQGLKNLARDLQVPVVALAQLNRGIEGRADKMPALSDLRESGGIEAAADVVMLMHRATAVELGDVTDLTLFIAKNRHGPQAMCHLTFEGAYSRAIDQHNRLERTA